MTTIRTVLARRSDLICAAAALFSLWMRTAVPVYAIGDATYDDALFVKLATSIGAGHWLGAFDSLTLVKGMAYPLFVFAAFAAGIPLKIAEQAVYLGVCYLLVRALRTAAGGASLLPPALFVLLALNPVLWTLALARVLRDGLYISETLLLVVSATSLAFHAFAAPAPRRGLLGSGLATGLAAAAFWLTREEGPWILPALAMGVAAAAEGRLRQAVSSPVRRGPALARLARLGAVPFSAAAAGFLIPLLAVATVNDRHYGAFELTEVQSREFKRAYAALADVEQNEWRRYVVFPKDARERAYRASPAARELAPLLEGPSGEGWRRKGCEASGMDDCREILAGWFQWALREGAAAAGHYSSAAAASAYYRDLADQIAAACTRGDLRCPAPRATLAPRFRLSYVGDALREVPQMAALLLRFGSGLIGSSPSVGSTEQIAWMAGMVGPVEPPPRLPEAVTGWVSAPGTLPTLRVEATGGPPSLVVATTPDAVLPTSKPGSAVGHFHFETRAFNRDARLIVTPSEGSASSLPLDALISDTELQSGEATIHVDEGFQPSWSDPSRRRERAMTRLADAIAAVYAALSLPATLFATVGLAVALCTEPAGASGVAFPAALALACGVGVVSRIALLCYLDVTAIPSANIIYMSAASPLLLVYIGIGCALGLKALRRFSDPRAAGRRGAEPAGGRGEHAAASR